MLVIPLPTLLLDLLITLNISAALAIVVATMYISKALEFSAFPTLLLLTTMFRLAINVSVTRLVLTTGDAGSVVTSFGQFVVGGNVVVGLVIFLILIVIQFVVVTNGAGRVAEVGRALHPGRHARQADGDRRRPQRRADHRRGGPHAPRRDRPRGRLLRRHGRRLEVRQGRRHGRRASSPRSTSSAASSSACSSTHLSFADATQHYSLLTVGDGLAAQIPALLISVATGIIVTRSALRARPRLRARQPDPAARRRRRWSPAA